MSNLRLAAIAAVGSGLLTACSSPATSPGLPNGAPVQPPTQSLAQSAQKSAPDAGVSSAKSRNQGRVLYIADIDGQPGVGQIHVYTAGMTNPRELRTITNGTGRPFGLWVDAKNDLYVANEADKYPASVTAFKPGASSPFLTITNLKGYPASVAVDANQNLYVNENVQDEGYVQEFAPGSTTAKATIDTGVGGYAFEPGGMGFDVQGNLIVAEQAKLALHIVKLAPGASQVSPVNLDLNGIIGPGLGIDKAGNIYVASSSGGTVSVFAPGRQEPSRTIAPVDAYGYTWVTAQGAVYQASGEYTVAEVAPGANSPSNVVDCECSAQGVAVSR